MNVITVTMQFVYQHNEDSDDHVLATPTFAGKLTGFTLPVEIPDATVENVNKILGDAIKAAGDKMVNLREQGLLVRADELRPAPENYRLLAKFSVEVTDL